MTEAIAIRRGNVRDRAFVIDLGKRVSATSVSSLRLGLPPLVNRYPSPNASGQPELAQSLEVS